MDSALAYTPQCLCLAARRASRAITRRFDQALREHGLRATQFSLLSTLTLAGPKSISQLAEILGNERTTITRNLAVVEGNSWVRTVADPKDARSRIASITSAGKAALQDALPTWTRVQETLVTEIGTAAATGLRQLAGGPCLIDPATLSTHQEQPQ